MVPTLLGLCLGSRSWKLPLVPSRQRPEAIPGKLVGRGSRLWPEAGKEIPLRSLQCYDSPKSFQGQGGPSHCKTTSFFG